MTTTVNFKRLIKGYRHEFEVDYMSISNRKRFEILKRDGFTCQYCGKKGATVRLEVDHIEPKSKGGADDDDNLITACFECNRGKGIDDVIATNGDIVAEFITSMLMKKISDEENSNNKILLAAVLSSLETFSPHAVCLSMLSMNEYSGDNYEWGDREPFGGDHADFFLKNCAIMEIGINCGALDTMTSMLICNINLCGKFYEMGTMRADPIEEAKER